MTMPVCYAVAGRGFTGLSEEDLKFRTAIEPRYATYVQAISELDGLRAVAPQLLSDEWVIWWWRPWIGWSEYHLDERECPT